MIRFVRNGKENGKTAYLAQRKLAGQVMTIGSILFDGQDWMIRRGGRTDRFGTLQEAKNEMRKS